MKDYRISVKVRNNRILHAIEAIGGTPGQKWCDANGLSYATVNLLIGLKVSPLTSECAISATAAKLCDVLDKLPEDLWSNDKLYPLEKNFSEMEMSHEQVVALLPQIEQVVMLDESGVAHRQLKDALDAASERMSDRQREVIRLRFEEEKTLEEVGQVFGVSKDRIRQIEAQVMRILRNPVHGLEEHL